MKIEDINNQLKEIKVDDKTKKALIKIIDLKTENDMEKILMKMQTTNWVIGISATVITILLTVITLFLAFKK